MTNISFCFSALSEFRDFVASGHDPHDSKCLLPLPVTLELGNTLQTCNFSPPETVTMVSPSGFIAKDTGWDSHAREQCNHVRRWVFPDASDESPGILGARIQALKRHSRCPFQMTMLMFSSPIAACRRGSNSTTKSCCSLAPFQVPYAYYIFCCRSRHS